jgi:hypothetical protein
VFSKRWNPWSSGKEMVEHDFCRLSVCKKPSITEFSF